jgi:hypothetical protein
MNPNMTKVSVVFVFAALFILAVSSAQASENIWFSGNGQYRPATQILNGGYCYSTADNNANIYLFNGSSPGQETVTGVCKVPDGRNYNIWLQANNP